MGKKTQPPRHPADVEEGHTARPPPPPCFIPPAPKSWFPWLVPCIFVANTAMFVFIMYFNDCPANNPGGDCLLGDTLGRFSFQPFKENPLLGASTQTLTKLGALERELVISNGELWRMFSCIWLHAGLIHLVANMFSLLFIGIKLEQEFGFFKIGFLYLLSGFGGSLLSALHQKQSSSPTISVGASGALFGLLGAMLSELLTNWTIYANKCVALLTLIVVIAINLAVGFLPRVDNSAHIGGFVMGFLLGFVLLIRPQYGYIRSKYIPNGYDVRRKSKYKAYQYALFVIALILLISGLAVGLYYLFRDRNSRKMELP